MADVGWIFMGKESTQCLYFLSLSQLFIKFSVAYVEREKEKKRERDSPFVKTASSAAIKSYANSRNDNLDKTFTPFHKSHTQTHIPNLMDRLNQYCCVPTQRKSVPFTRRMKIIKIVQLQGDNRVFFAHRNISISCRSSAKGWRT